MSEAVQHPDLPDTYHPDPAILALAPWLASEVAPADFPETRIRFRNDRAAASLGLAGLDDAEWAAHFGQFAPLPGNLPAPLALKYHGHQFRSYNPDIGDGRGFLFAQMRDGIAEPAIVTAGNEVTDLVRLLPNGADRYAAADVLNYLQGTLQT